VAELGELLAGEGVGLVGLGEGDADLATRQAVQFGLADAAGVLEEEGVAGADVELGVGCVEVDGVAVEVG